MSFLRGISGLLFLMVFGVPASHAETHVVDVCDLAIEVSPVGILNSVDLNATTTANSVLPTSEVSWGTLKAIYSGTR